MAIAEGIHPFPSRTRPLSLPTPMVLEGQPSGRVGNCRANNKRKHSCVSLNAFFCYVREGENREMGIYEFQACKRTPAVFFRRLMRERIGRLQDTAGVLSGRLMEIEEHESWGRGSYFLECVDKHRQYPSGVSCASA